MSFLDEELDESPRRSGSRRPPPRGPGVDSQTLWVRRAIAVGVGLLVVLLLVFGVRSCLGARKKQAFRNYVRDVSSLVQESNQESQQLFDVLKVPTSGTPSPVDLTNNANGVRVQSEQLVDRANGTSHPSEMNAAHRYLLEVLEFRRDGITAVANDLRTALGDTGRQQAVNQMAADMQNFLTSDVIYSQRFVPEYQKQLKKEDLLGETQVPKSAFLPDINWLQPTVVAVRIGRIRGGGTEQLVLLHRRHARAARHLAGRGHGQAGRADAERHSGGRDPDHARALAGRLGHQRRGQRRD